MLLQIYNCVHIKFPINSKQRWIWVIVVHYFNLFKIYGLFSLVTKPYSLHLLKIYGFSEPIAHQSGILYKYVENIADIEALISRMVQEDVIMSNGLLQTTTKQEQSMTVSIMKISMIR